MRLKTRIGVGVLLALLNVTCTDKNVVGPQRYGSTALNLRAFASPTQPGMPNIPLDSVRVVLQRLPGLDTAANKVYSLAASRADSLQVDLSVSLDRDPESFQLTVSAYGGNAIWYIATDTTLISSSAPASPVLAVRYVGPGAGATSVSLAPVDTTVTGGQAIALRITVDSGAVPLANVPIGLLSSDSTKGKVTQPTATTGSFTGAAGIRDSVWLYVETPTHLRDSTRIHVVPPPSKLVKIGGDSQTVIVNGTTAVPLAVRVEDALNGGSPGVAVTWTVTQGSATISPPSPVTSDTGGYARVSITPSSLGTVKVQASATGLTGSPITFTVNVLAGIVHQVIVAPKLDTLAKGATVQFSATLKDSLGNTITTVKPVWTSSNSSVATVDTTGFTTALAGDSTYIIASAGGYADTARVFVRAPSKVVLTPADTVITSIGDSVHLTGIVLTNFGDTVKTATVIRFASTVPSVVTVNAVTGEATLVGAGNGVVQATDTISKVTGTATLRVNQKVFSIANTPPDSIEVGVSGQAQILATAKDKNGHAIPGKTFGWLTRNASVATVNQTGVVTGVALGPTYAVDTLVDSVTVFRDSTLVSVVTTPPKVMRWAFDTLAIGNGGNTTVTVSLNVPSANGTTVQIISADTTKVKPTQSKVTIGTGGASASVTLQGLAATVAPVNVIAQDSAGIYPPDTLRVIVVSTIFFTQVNQSTRTQDFYLNQNETLNGQIFLSDPAPAGGLGVTLVFSKGFSSANPTTVVIPAGQLSAPVQFVGTGVGTDSVTPSSGAFAGKFSYLHVAKDTLTLAQPYPYNGIIGLGQTEQPYTQITYSMDHQRPFNIAVTPPAIATVVPNPDTILTGSASRLFTVTGTAVGAGTITVSATNWLSTTIPLTVTTPQIIAGGLTSMVAGNPTLGGWNAYSGDTTRYSHPVVAPLAIQITSRDTTVVKVMVDTLTIPAGQNYNSSNNSLFAQPGAGGDSTWLVETAPGYKPDSFLVHVTKPTMSDGYGYPYDGRVALNTTFQNPIYVGIPYARTDTFAVVLKHTNKAGFQAPDTLFIPKGQTTGYLTSITGVSLGVDSVSIDTTKTKPGYVLPTGVQWVLYVDPLHVRTYNYPTSLVTISAPTVINAFAYDSVNGQPRNLNSPITVTLALSRPNVVTLDSAKVTIPVGSAYSNYDTMRVAAGVAAPDSTRILTTAPGSSPDSSTYYIKVSPTALNLALGYGGQVGKGLRTSYSNYAYLPSAAPNSLTVTLSHAVPGKDSLVPSTVIIPKGQSSSNYFDLQGLDSIGTDTILATATGFVPGRSTVYLEKDTLEANLASTWLTTSQPVSLPIFLFGKNGYNMRPSAPVTITAISSDPTVIAIDSGFHVNAQQDTVTSVVDTSQTYGYVRLAFKNPGTVFLKLSAPGYPTDSIGPITVTGPSLSLYQTTNTTGVGQIVLEQVSVQNPVTGSPLVITVQRSDSNPLAGASHVFNFSPVTLTIPVGSNFSNYDTLTGDTIGTAQLIATAPGYGPATATIQVGKPQLLAPSNISLLVGAQPASVQVNAEDQVGNNRSVSAPLSVTATITDPTVATVDTATKVIPAGTYYLSGFRFTGLKKGSVQAVFSAAGYKSDTMLISVDTATMTISAPTSIGVGLQENASINLPFYTSTPVTVNLSSTNPGVFTVPAQVVIPANQYNVTFLVQGTGVGTAQIQATATGFKNATPVGLVVTPARLFISPQTSANAGQQLYMYVYAQDTLGNFHPVINPVSATLSSNAGAHASFQTNPVTILAGNDQTLAYVTFDTAGSFNLTASATGFESGTYTPITISGVEIKVGVGNALTFTPQVDTIPVGTTVTWVWDATNTNSHGVGWYAFPIDAKPNDSNVQSSGTYSWTFTEAATYGYRCIVHSSAMTGTIVVQ